MRSYAKVVSFCVHGNLQCSGKLQLCHFIRFCFWVTAHVTCLLEREEEEGQQMLEHTQHAAGWLARKSLAAGGSRASALLELAQIQAGCRSW